MNAVITYIFGANQEILREPLIVEPNVEYICVTDQRSLRSNIWNIIYDTIPYATCARDRMAYVKYNPFKYTNANHICVIDGSIEISNRLKTFFNRLSNVDMLVKRHPQRNNLSDELHTWHTRRNLSLDSIYKFISMSLVDHISLDNNFLIESCVLGYNASNFVKRICATVLAYMKWLGVNNHLCVTNQCVLTYLIQKYHPRIGFIRQPNYFIRYSHNTWKINQL